jgi:hypothetical protein
MAKSRPAPGTGGDYEPCCEKGKLDLDGSFLISGVHNHYSSGGVPQSFAAVIDILDKKDKLKARIKFSNFQSRVRVDNVVEEIVPEPTMVNGVLHVPQPLSALPLWEMVLTTLPSGSYYISFTVSEKDSWAFLTPNANTRHKIGPQP